MRILNHLGTVEIKTERLLLRRFTLEDVESVYRNYGSDPLVNRYISFAPCKERESCEDFIQMHTVQYEKNPAFYGWAVCLDGQVIGSIGLFDVEEDSCAAELGYSIGSRWWGKGYATEAGKAVLDFAFEQVGMVRIHASHHIENVGSGRVLQKIGMEQIGIQKNGQENPDGTFADLVLYEIKR